MSYRPKDKELVLTTDPDNPNLPPTIAFVVREATRNDKESFLNRMKARLGPGEEIDEESLVGWMESHDVFLCMEQDEISLTSIDNIQGPFVEEPTGLI
jgi:hypothetical protein